MSGRSKVSVVFLTAAVAPGPRAAPFGAARVASALRSAYARSGLVEARIVEGFASDSAETLVAKALETAPLIVGLSLYSWNSRLLVAAGALIKKRCPHCVIVAGGPDASATPDRLYREGTADIVVAGEGEAAMVDIVSAILNGRALPGPVIRAPLLDHSLLTSPWLDGTLDPARWSSAPLELTRGCPYRCSFCFESKGSSRLRRFPLDIVRKELEHFSKASVAEVFVLDPTFNADERRMEAAVLAFREAGPNLRYMIELRAELLNAKQALLLSSINCAVQIGLQSADPAVLANVNRSIVPEAFAAKVRLLEAAGVTYGLDLIYGLPGDTLSGFKRSLDYALALGPNHLDVFRLAVLPGTELADKADELGLAYDRDAPYLVHSTPSFSTADLKVAEQLARAADLFYTKGRAVMWFRALLALIGARPSAFLARFAEWLAARSGKGPHGQMVADIAGNLIANAETKQAAIEALQLAFLSEWFAGKPPKGGATAVEASLDLVRASGAWTRALAEGEETKLELGWQPLDLLDYAAADIRTFSSRCAPSPGRWLCAPGKDGPRFKKAK